MSQITHLTRKIGRELEGFGGHLECTTCGSTQALGDVSVKLAHGWPKCCGYTMRWITRRQEEELAGSQQRTGAQ